MSEYREPALQEIFNTCENSEYKCVPYVEGSTSQNSSPFKLAVH